MKSELYNKAVLQPYPNDNSGATVMYNDHKVPTEFRDPVDKILLGVIGKPIAELMRRYNFTPNMITSLGVVARVISLYFLFNNLQNSKILFFAFAMLGYFFDCLDGYYARRYGMCSKFGDYYDHTSDLIFHVVLIYYLYNSKNFKKSEHYCLITFILIVLLFMTLTHFGCQETFFVNSGDCYSPTLSIFKCLCSHPNLMKFTRYFGSGVTATIFYLIVAYFKN